MDFNLAFYLADQWLIALVMLGLLIAAVLLLIMDVNRPQRGMISVGIDTLERAHDSIKQQSMH